MHSGKKITRGLNSQWNLGFVLGTLRDQVFRGDEFLIPGPGDAPWQNWVVVLLLHTCWHVLIKGTRQRSESLSADCVFKAVIIGYSSNSLVWWGLLYEWDSDINRDILFLSADRIIDFNYRVSGVDSSLEGERAHCVDIRGTELARIRHRLIFYWFILHFLTFHHVMVLHVLANETTFNSCCSFYKSWFLFFFNSPSSNSFIILIPPKLHIP